MKGAELVGMSFFFKFHSLRFIEVKKPQNASQIRYEACSESIGVISNKQIRNS